MSGSRKATVVMLVAGVCIPAPTRLHAAKGISTDNTPGVGLSTLPVPQMYRDVLRSELPAQGGVLLEIGTGSGRLLNDLNRALGNGHKYVGLDLAPSALAGAKNNHRNKISLAQMNATDVGFAASSVNAVILHAVLNALSLTERESALRHVQRILQPGGVLLVSDFGRRRHPGHVRKYISFAVNNALRGGRWDFGTYMANPDGRGPFAGHHFSRRDLMRLGRVVGPSIAFEQAWTRRKTGVPEKVYTAAFLKK